MNRTALSLILVCAALLAGCGKKEAPASKSAELVGITYKGGKGLRISDETKKIIGLELVEASEQKLADVFSFDVQVYQTNGGIASATGFVSEEESKELKEGQPVSLEPAKGDKLAGTLAKLNRAGGAALQGVEVLIEVPESAGRCKVGDLLQATFTAWQAQLVTAIPRSSVLQTVEGKFVYVVNGNNFFRTAIKTGVESTNFVEVKEGLYAGDQIVKQPVMPLWLAELQAIKGGADND